MTKKRRIAGIATLSVMILFGLLGLRADETGEIFQQLKDTMQAFKQSDSEVIKKWPDVATSDEALNRLAIALCGCQQVRYENLFTMRDKPIDKAETIEGITIGEEWGGPYLEFFQGETTTKQYKISARYQEGVWKPEGYVTCTYPDMQTEMPLKFQQR